MSDEAEGTPPTGPMGIPHFEDVNAPLVYADACAGGGLTASGDNITLTFVAKFLDHRHNPPQAGTKTVLRLVMPREAMISTAQFVVGFVESLEAGKPPPPPANSKLN